MTDWEYDPALDRLDVSVRAVWHDATVRNGRLLREAGVSEEVIRQVQALSRERERPLTENQVFAVIKQVPGMLDAAALMLLRYYQQCGVGRPAFYQRLEEVLRETLPSAV